MNENKCYLRFFHAVSDVGPVEFYANDKLISTLYYRGFSEYHPAVEGTYKISVYLKTTKELVFEEEIFFGKDIYTFALTGLSSELSGNLISSDNEKPNKSKAIMRFCNVAPFDTDFDIYINSNKGVVGLNYEEVTEFFTLNGGNYSIKLTDSTTGETKLEDPRMVLKKGNVYTGYIVGVEGKGQGLQILIPLEGVTYINL